MSNNINNLNFIPKTGDVAICRGKAVLSNVIVKATRGDWSHTAQFIYINGKLYVIDAQKEGVFPRTFEDWIEEYEYDFEVYRNPKHVNEGFFIDNAMQYCGVGYDKEHLIVGLFKSLVGAKKINKKFKNNGKFICSEYTMKLIGVEDPHNYSPQKVRDYLISNAWIKVGNYESK